MLARYDKLHRFHESDLSAQEAGLPKAQWFTTESLVDERGRSTRQQVERRVQTRTLSLLKADTSAKRPDLPQLKGGDPRPFEVVGLPLAEPGYHVVEIESARLGQSLLEPRAPMYVRTGVLVTNLGVHVKLGRENSAVWVTCSTAGGRWKVPTWRSTTASASGCGSVEPMRAAWRSSSSRSTCRWRC